MRRIAITASAAASGKSTVGRAAAERLGVPYTELDALHHGPNWTEATAEELRAKVEPLVAQDGWVIDGGYVHKIGFLVFDRADTVVWLDLPMRASGCRGCCGAPTGASATTRSSGTATARASAARCSAATR